MSQKFFELDEYWTNLLQGVDAQLQGRGMEELFVIAEAQISDCSPEASDIELEEATNFLVAAYLMWSRSRESEKLDLNELTTLSASLTTSAATAASVNRVAYEDVVGFD